MIVIVVPDASVLLKWSFNEPDEADRDKTLSFLNAWLDGKVEIILPHQGGGNKRKIHKTFPLPWWEGMLNYYKIFLIADQP